MTLFDNLIVVGVFFTIGIIAYCKVTGRTFSDFVKELKEIFEDKQEEYIL